jgi:Fe-S cluster assembly protein SufD
MTTNGAVADTPTSREEAWRYTPVDEIIARMGTAATATRAIGMSVSRSVVDALAGSHDGPRLVFVNGFYEAELSDHHDLPAGLWCGLARPHHPPTDALVAQTENVRTVDGLLTHNRTDGHDVAVVIADDGARFDEPVHIVHVAVPDHREARTSVISHPRTIIDVGKGSHLAVVETYCGLDGPTVTDTSTTIRIADRAELDQCRIQIESPAATHIGHTRAEQGAGSQLRMTSITVGGDIARNAIDVHLDAPDAHTELTGVNMTTGHQRHDTVVTVDHAASRCASSQRFAGVVDDHGRGSFSGEIIVRPGTVATDAHQSNRNLVLDPNAEADTRPWLKILADDVRCTHGATVGRLDDDTLFYLRSRGIALAKARTMLIDAFIRDITDAIAHESVRAHVAALITATATGPAATGTKESA